MAPVFCAIIILLLVQRIGACFMNMIVFGVVFLLFCFLFQKWRDGSKAAGVGLLLMVALFAAMYVIATRTAG